MTINYFAATALINTVFSVFLGAVVYFKNRKEDLNKIFVLFCLSVASWAGLYFLWIVLGTSHDTALFFGKALNMAAIFIPITYFHFVALLLGIYKEKRKLIISGYWLSLVLFILGPTFLFVKDVAPEASLPWYPKAGPAFVVFALSFSFYIVYSWYLMIKAITKKNNGGGTTSLQIKYVLFGSLIGFVGGSMNFLPVFGIQIPPYGTGLSFIYVVFFTFAILKYHMFEIRLILTEVLVVIIAGVSLAEALLFKDFLAKVLGFSAFGLFCLIGYLLIRSMHKEISAKDLLEQRVNERTLELKQSNDKLVKAFDELKESQQELEKWYKLTIGREVRMAELKEKIKEMEDKTKI
ncbi:MAG: histidine kinase N-terminal 7TM domain-containing protein [Candidatus Paceibacterota bacterium]|jgi:hypothetical protein